MFAQFLKNMIPCLKMLKFASNCVCFVKRAGWNSALTLEALGYDGNEKSKQSCLEGRSHLKVNGSFNPWQEIVEDVLQGSVFDPSYLMHLWTCNYADDMTIYECGHDLEHIISGLETDGQSSPNGLLITAWNQTLKIVRFYLKEKHTESSADWRSCDNKGCWRKPFR